MFSKYRICSLSSAKSGRWTRLDKSLRVCVLKMYIHSVLIIVSSPQIGTWFSLMMKENRTPPRSNSCKWLMLGDKREKRVLLYPLPFFQVSHQHKEVAVRSTQLVHHGSSSPSGKRMALAVMWPALMVEIKYPTLVLCLM